MALLSSDNKGRDIIGILFEGNGERIAGVGLGSVYVILEVEKQELCCCEMDREGRGSATFNKEKGIFHLVKSLL